MADDDTPRCARRLACAEAERVPNTDPTAAARFRHVGAVLTRPGRAYCEPDVRHLGYTIRALALDCAELTMLLVPSMAVRYRHPDIPAAPRIKLHAPLPLDGRAEGLRALVDYEVTVAADLTAAAAGVPWDAQLAEHSRLGARVQTGAELLVRQIDHLLGLPATTYGCRSAGEHPTDGHDEDDVTFDGTTYWITRDGTALGELFFDLHDRVERYVGRIGAQRLRTPCPHCGGRLVREHPRAVLFGVGPRHGEAGQVLCRGCWKSLDDDEYEVAERLHGLRMGPYQEAHR